MTPRSAPTYVELRARLARAEYDAWTLRYVALCARRDSGAIDAEDSSSS